MIVKCVCLDGGIVHWAMSWKGPLMTDRNRDVQRLDNMASDCEYAAIYINGDTMLDDPHKRILLTEQVFGELISDMRGL